MAKGQYQNLPSSNASYGSVEYWNQRFKEEKEYDWLLGYSEIRDYIQTNVEKSDRILMLGCGNSLMSEEMFKDGYLDVTNIDYSSVVIQGMASHCETCSQMKWLNMDAKELHFPNDYFDVVIEKATIDSFFVTEADPWNISQNTRGSLESILSEVSRVLKMKGRFISVSFTQPHFRGPFYVDPMYNWSFSKKEIGAEFHKYIYLMVKGEEIRHEDIFIYEPPTVTQNSNGENFNFCASDEDFLSSIEDNL